MKSREELKAEVLADIRKTKMKELVILQIKLKQVTRIKLTAPTTQGINTLEHEINTQIKTATNELDLIEEAMKESK